MIAFNEPPNDEMLDSLKQFSELFSLPYLKQTCENIENDEEELNPTIGAFLSDTTAAKIKELFFNSPQKADIKFIFEGKNSFEFSFGHIVFVMVSMKRTQILH